MWFTYKACYFLDPEEEQRNLPIGWVGWGLMLLGIIIGLIFMAIPLTIIPFHW